MTTPQAPRLLVVDDSPNITALLAEMLAAADYSVCTENSAEAVLCRPDLQLFDAAILDLKLEGALDGIELGRLLRQRVPGIGLVLITGYGSEEVAANALRVGFDDYVRKPFGEAEILAAAHAAVWAR